MQQPSQEQQTSVGGKIHRRQTHLILIRGRECMNVSAIESAFTRDQVFVGVCAHKPYVANIPQQRSWTKETKLSLKGLFVKLYITAMPTAVSRIAYHLEALVSSI